ncbi:MAG: hypothetical protein V4709_03730 [Pseudomonadota bacterium]
MKKLAQASTALLLTGATTAMAAGVDSSFGEARLYWRTSFGESQSQPSEMKFGMTLDYDRRFENHSLPLQPAAQVQFDRAGFVNASLNGMPFARRVSLQQAEGETAGGTSYTVVDYSLLAIGAVGIGFGISEVVNQKDTPDAPSAGPGTPPGMPPAGPSSPSVPGVPGLPGLPGLPPGAPSLPGLPALPGLPGLAGAYQSFEERAVTPEYQQWLDDGTGGMGDLVVIKD